MYGVNLIPKVTFLSHPFLAARTPTPVIEENCGTIFFISIFFLFFFFTSFDTFLSPSSEMRSA